jgi:hypothetical protein
LTARVERVASSAYIEVDIAAQGRTRGDSVTAAAFCGNFGVFRMNIGFHGRALRVSCRHQGQKPDTATGKNGTRILPDALVY